MNLSLNVLTLSLTMLFLTACNATPPNLPHQSGVSPTALEMNSVTIIDNKLLESKKKAFSNQEYGYGKIHIESTGTAQTATGTQEVWVTFTNLTDFPQNIEAHVRFYDKNKRPIEAYSAWKRVLLAPKGTGTYQESSLSDAAAYFYVEVREAQ